MAIEEFDIKALKFLNRMARYYSKWSIHEHLPMNLKDPRKVFIIYANEYISRYVKDSSFPNYEEPIFDTFITACAMLWLKKELKPAVVELWSLRRNGITTEKELEDLEEILKNER